MFERVLKTPLPAEERKDIRMLGLRQLTDQSYPKLSMRALITLR